MATTVSQLLGQIDELVHEDSSFSSGLWTTAELLDYINGAQSDLILLTQAIKRSDQVNSVAGTRLYSDPAGSMQIDRITFANVPLERTNRNHLDLGNAKWKTLPGAPRFYHQDHLAPKQFEVDRAPTAAMVSASMHFSVVSTALPTDVSALGSNLGIPDYAVFILKFRVLAAMLSKQGEAQDLKKAAYCNTRFLYGCQLLARLMVGE